MLYLDANATESPRPEATEAALAAMRLGGNPSSVHAQGRAARRLLENAREAIANRLGAAPADIVLTAGGTEANALALHGLGQGRADIQGQGRGESPGQGRGGNPEQERGGNPEQGRGKNLGQTRRILAGATEHAAIRAIHHTVIPVLADGTLDLDALVALLRDGPPALVAVMAANNETGVLHPIAEVAALCHAHDALLHVDAVQAAGRVAVPPGWDSLAISGHKLGGPMGAGALLLRPGLHPSAMISGGGQERGRRGGTEPLPAIAGMAAALTPPGAMDHLAALRDAIEAGLPNSAIIAGQNAPRLPNTAQIILPGIAADRQVMVLDQMGICVSAGAACSSGKVARSHVLEAMGFAENAGCGIRVSLPWDAPPDVATRFLAAYTTMVARLSRG